MTETIDTIKTKGCMSGLKKEIINNLQILKLSCFFVLLLASYNSFSQTRSVSDDLNALQGGITEWVNTNLADAETIAMVLDGVGLSRAEAIVDYRESMVISKAIDDLIMVSGIGEVTVRNNVDKIVFINDLFNA